MNRDGVVELTEAVTRTSRYERVGVEVFHSFGRPSTQLEDRVALGEIMPRAHESRVSRRALSERMAKKQRGLARMFRRVLSMEAEISYRDNERHTLRGDGSWETSKVLCDGWRDIDDPAWWLVDLPTWLTSPDQVSSGPASERPGATLIEGVVDLTRATGREDGLALEQRGSTPKRGRRHAAKRSKSLRFEALLTGRDGVTRFSYEFPSDGPYEERFWVTYALDP